MTEKKYFVLKTKGSESVGFHSVYYTKVEAEWMMEQYQNNGSDYFVEEDFPTELSASGEPKFKGSQGFLFVSILESDKFKAWRASKYAADIELPEEDDSIECDLCDGTGLCSLGPITDMLKGITEHSKCHRCDGRGRYVSSLEFKINNNIWDHVSDFKSVYNKMLKKEWRWVNNWNCKYVELRIDMRDGGCIIMDQNRKRISPEQLAYQRKHGEE